MKIIQKQRSAFKALAKGRDFKENKFNLFRDDKAVVSIAVRINGWNLLHASKRLQDDSDIVALAIRKNANSMSHASDRLKDDKSFIMENIQKCCNGTALANYSERLKKDRDVVLASVKMNGLALTFANDEFKNDQEIVLAAINNSKLAIQFASDNLKDSEEFILELLRNESKRQHKYMIDMRGELTNLVLINPLSYSSQRIKDLVDGKDPIEILEKVVLHKQLQQTFSEPTSLSTKKPNKI